MSVRQIPSLFIFSLDAWPRHIVENAQQSRETKTPNFWPEDWEGKPQRTRKCQGDRRDEGNHENSPLELCVNSWAHL